MKTTEDFQSLQAQAILRLNCPGIGKSALLNSGDAHPLTEYKVIIVNPISIVHLFDHDPGVIRQIDMAQADGLTSCRIPDPITIDRIAQQIELRSAELFQFLADGGLLIYYLCRPFLVTSESRSMDNYAWLCGLAPDQSGEATTGEQTIRHMSTVAHGRNIDKTLATGQSKFNEYFNQVGLEWNTIIRTDFLTNGYTALALAGPKKCIAGELIAGDKGGRVIFLPAPYSPDFDRVLIDSIHAWYSDRYGLSQPVPVGDQVQTVDGSIEAQEPRIITEQERRDEESSTVAAIVAGQEASQKAARVATKRVSENEGARAARQTTQGDIAASNIAAEEELARAARQAAQEELARASRIAAEEELARAARQAAQEELARASRMAVDDEAARVAAKQAAEEEMLRIAREAAEEEAVRVARQGAQEDMAIIAKEVAQQNYSGNSTKVPSPAAAKIANHAAAKIANQSMTKIARQADITADPAKQALMAKIDMGDMTRNESAFPSTPVSKMQASNNAQIEKLARELDDIPMPNNGRQSERADARESVSQNASSNSQQFAGDENSTGQGFPDQQHIAKETSFKPENADQKESGNDIDFANGQSPAQINEGGPIPEWCKSYWLPGMDNLIKEVQVLRKQIKDLEKQLVSNESTILSLEGIKSTLLTAKAGNPLASCKVVLDTLGWRTEFGGQNPSELVIIEDNHPIAVARIAISQGQSERTELAKLTATLINFWDNEGNEPKGILIACTFTDIPVAQRKTPDFPDIMIDFAKRKNVCLISTTQLISIYLEAKLGKSPGTDIRAAIMSTSGVLTGFTL